MLSIIIPSYKDPFLLNTITSALNNAQGSVEIIPVLDGYKPDMNIEIDPRIIPIYFAKNLGMRAAINSGIKKARGKHVMKCDSHCAFAKGFDKILTANCEENWLVIPRRYSLETSSWSRKLDRPSVDYHLLTYPAVTDKYGVHLSNQNWPERDLQRTDQKYNIDDTMTFQGSLWLANKKYFSKYIGPLDDNPKKYGSFADEPQEIGLKYWLGGGKIKVVKKTWYAHLIKRQHHYDAGLFIKTYKLGAASGHTWSARHWMGNKEPNMKHPISWLIEKFWPVPTWPEDRNLWRM